MLKKILLAFLTACSAPASASDTATTAPDEQPLAPPNDIDEPEDQHFCCQEVNVETKSGENCITIPKESIDACAEVLFCPGFWAKHKGVVTCE